MVFRSLKIADELAASSVVRGIESPYKKEGYYLNKMAVSDGVMIAAVYFNSGHVYLGVR